MAYEQRDMSGTAFKNRRADKPNSAHLTGSAMIDGKEYWVNTWVRSDKNGDDWHSYSFKPKLPKAQNETQQESVPAPELDDPIPF